MSNAVSAHGTALIWNYLKVLELTNISGPSEVRETIDVTSHDSPDKYREFLAGFGNGGDISLEGFMYPDDALGQVALHTDMQAGTQRVCYVVLPMAVGGSMSFNALATAFSGSFPVEDAIGISGTLKVVGRPTLVVTQSTGISGLTGIEQNLETALVITPAIAAGTYAYTCSVNTASTWVKLTVTAASHTIKAQGVTQTSGVQGEAITLGAAGTDTDILIMVWETDKSPRLYTLTVTRAAS